MEDRLIIASTLLSGMLAGTFIDRPTAKPNTKTMVRMALEYADALIEQAKELPDA